MKLLSTILFLVFTCSSAFSQLNCANYQCEQLGWLDQIMFDLLDPNNNPSIGGCVPRDVITQCDYKGQSVIVVRGGSCIIADQGNQVYDCAGNFIFGFGGFCITFDGSPCPGDIEATFLEECEVIFTYSDGPAAQCPDTNIPTMSEWGLIALSLLILIVSVVFLSRPEGSLDYSVDYKK